MHKFKKIFMICLMAAICLGTVKNSSIYANEIDNAQDARQSQILSNSITDNHIFGVFGGGWSSIKYEITYNEYYRTLGAHNEFSKRVIMLVFSSSGATSVPYIKLSGTTHYYGNNKKVFSNWKDIPILHGTEWDNGRARENTETVIYSTNTEVIGRQPFLVICEGANFGIVPNSVDLSLKTY